MSPVGFRLAPLLAQYEATRHECRAALAEVLLEEGRLKDHQRSLLASLESQRQHRRHAGASGVLDPALLAESRRYELTLEVELRAVEQLLAVIAGHIDQRQQAVAAANGRVRGLETLREADRERRAQSAAAREWHALDEAAARTVTRRAA